MLIKDSTHLVKEFVLWKAKKSTASLHQPANKDTDMVHKQGRVHMHLSMFNKQEKESVFANLQLPRR